MKKESFSSDTLGSWEHFISLKKVNGLPELRKLNEIKLYAEDA